MRQLISNLDFWGCTTSVLCAIHCAILPILLSMGLIGSHSWLNQPFFELVIILFTFIFVYNSIIKSYLNHKRNYSAFLLACAGLMLIGVHHLLDQYSTTVVVLGGLSIAAAHFVNFYSLSHRYSK